MRDPPPDKGFRLLCPSGACDEKSDYRALVYKGERAEVHIFFDAAATHARDLASIRRTFHYANVFLDFPDRSSQGFKGGYQNQTPLCTIEVSSVAGGRMRGVVWGMIDYVTYKKIDGDGCNNTDGPLPPGCRVFNTINKPFRVEFDLAYPLGPVNCAATDRCVH